MKNIIKQLLREHIYEKSIGYKRWKLKNVTLRGISNTPGEFNGAGAILGDGLYTACLGNKTMAKGYGSVYFVVGAVPKKPKVFNTLNDWEIWFYNTLVYQYSKANGKEFPDKRDFYQNTTIEKELIKMGYDGIIIKGREMVNYTPQDVKYFKTENELLFYYNQHQIHDLNETTIDNQQMNSGTQTLCNTMSVATYKEGLKLIIDAIGQSNQNPELWKKIALPLKNWQEADLSIGNQVKTDGMSGDSMVDESNTWFAAIQSTICEQGQNYV